MTAAEPRYMNRVAQALAVGGCHSTCEIAVAVDMNRNEVAKACCRLVSADWIVRRARGCFELTEKGRAAIAAGETLKSGPHGPLTQERPRRPRRVTDVDRIWRAMRVQKKFSMASIAEVTGARADNVGKFIRRLTAAGYLLELNVEPGFAPTSNGFKRWSLIDDTGFQTPSIVRRGGVSHVYDRNTGLLRPLS